MAFIVKKTISGKDYYYLNENKRVDGKVKTKTLAYLGKTKRDAKKKAKEILASLPKTKGRTFSPSAKVTNNGSLRSPSSAEVKLKLPIRSSISQTKASSNERQPKGAEKKRREMMKGKVEEKTKIKEMKSHRDHPNGRKKKVNLSRGEKTEKIFSMANTRGFFFNTASIYGGKAGFFTYGHLGKLLKTNWENLWREYYLNLNDNFYEIQSNSILPEPVFVASGHIESFNDPMVECKKCHARFRVDNLLEDEGLEDVEVLSVEEMDKEIKERSLKCKRCKGDFAGVMQFNMMFPVNVGIGQNSKSYLGPETAQGAYLTFKDEFLATRSRIPLGLAIIDKAYRNEISPRQGFFRLREFSQAELQIFFDPDKINEHEKWEEVKNKKLYVKFVEDKKITEISCEDLNQKKKIPKFYVYHALKVQDFYLGVLKIPKEKFRFRELSEKERAFYNKIHFDVEIILDTVGGFKEVGGVHYRTDHDLAGHQKVSGKNLSVSVDGKKFIPHVLELSFGVDRNVFSFLDVFFDKGKEGFIFSFPPKLAPIKAAIFPIVKQKEFEKISEEVFNDLKKEWNVVYDKSGSIGRRYARNDEIGTPFCITVDGDSLKNKDVTIRNRNTAKQIRVKISELKNVLRKLINEEVEFRSAGKLIK
ncbi:glycine--tRNA ligase [Candidatus Pacearchaeota archaeon]|nr:glycine--tRNA ligase [Candidatus Pacearchaeota archaeon]